MYNDEQKFERVIERCIHGYDSHTFALKIKNFINLFDITDDFDNNMKRLEIYTTETKRDKFDPCYKFYKPCYNIPLNL